MLKLPITGGAYKNVDEVSLTDTSPALIDGYVDDAGNTVKRPGLSVFSNLNISSHISGLYWWEAKQKVIIVSGGSIWTLNLAGTATKIADGVLQGSVRPTFADNGTILVIANGGKMVSFDGSTATVMSSSSVSQNVTHVAFHDQYILCNEVGTGRFHYSGINDPLTWNAINFATAESRPDNIVAISVAWREILLVGSQSVERWYNDGVTPFSRMEGSYTERGCIAPYSLTEVDNTWVWLDNTRRLVKLEGATPKIISTPFDKLIQGFSTVNDAIGDLIEIDGRNFFVLTFPIENKTLVWNYAQNSWSEWGYWNLLTATHDRFLGSAHCWCPDWGIHLIGDRRTGLIYKMSSDYYDDAGDVIRTLRRTGHIDHNMLGRKRSKEIIIKMKRGTGNANVTDPKLMLRWRNNNSIEWSSEQTIDLGKMGETEWIGRIRRLGTYRSRQYEFSHTDRNNFILVGAEEDVEVIR